MLRLSLFRRNAIPLLMLGALMTLPVNASLAASNQPPAGIRFDGLVSAGELESLVDQPVAIKLRSGRFIVKVVLDALQFDRKQNGLKFLKYRSETGRTSTVKVEDLYMFWVGRQRFHLRYFPPTRQLFVINAAAADAAAEGRLAAQGKQIREQADEEQQAEATAEHLRFLEDAAKTLKDVGQFHVIETESTLLFTDYPAAATGGLRVFVDKLNQQLNQMFGLPQGDSIWRGKAILAVFSTPARFAAFEEQVMNNPNHGGRAGVRGGAKRFLQTAIAKKLDSNVARGLSWGYSLGFAGRLHSDANTVPWMNMGIANAVQFAIVPDRKRQSTQRSKVTRQLRNAGSMLGLLGATKLDQERWPMCGQLVQFLIQSDPIAFSQMFRDVKLGVPMEEALQQNYGLNEAALAARFGQSLGVPGLGP
ncbi:hypothetical protein Enr13x_17780 [Stieleria neptunia]|uniref:Guanylate cyclase domain-containing protein n=1 Tax=Stieleria neptunia TaxID=2527979 RepID=A0A518HM60_9BACT|nr:hypothetical protein [Stieleria neptunia]QDV41935.1 hypothetical protein Enr13x_17780 [Stieleria neptunia]